MATDSIDKAKMKEWLIFSWRSMENVVWTRSPRTTRKEEHAKKMNGSEARHLPQLLGGNESLEVHWWHLSKWILCRQSSHRQTCYFPPKEQQRKLIGQQWIWMGCEGKLYPLTVSFQICKGWWQWRKEGALFNRGSSVSKLSSWSETSTEDIE